MILLSIETSCDDTGISILECAGGRRAPTFRVLADNLSSQAKLHANFGGVFPPLAKREHIKSLPILLEKRLTEAGISCERSLGRSDGDGQRKFLAENFRAESARNAGLRFDAMAVTSGPGLEPCLWAGITFAQKLAQEYKVPVIPVNHMAGHIWSVLLQGKKIQFPA